MHMADALVSPAVGGTMWAVTGGLIAFSARHLKAELDERKVPLMGVLGAFIFSAQMINFSIPGTGSSGHLGGGMILSILLGPHAAFLTIASVVTVQALFFADGGLLALGCNIFNMGFFPCFIAYPFIYKKVVGAHATQGRILTGAILSALFGLQLGAFSVVLETRCSHVSELPFSLFVVLMQPIHLAIGFVEGLVTSAVVTTVWKARPELIDTVASGQPMGSFPTKKLVVGLALVTLLTGGVFSWFASSHPDGLEWAMLHTSGKEAIDGPADSAHDAAGKIQEKTAILPDYEFKTGTGGEESEELFGTSVAGLAGAVITLVLVGVTGLVLRARVDRKPKP